MNTHKEKKQLMISHQIEKSARQIYIRPTNILVNHQTESS